MRLTRGERLFLWSMALLIGIGLTGFLFAGISPLWAQVGFGPVRDFIAMTAAGHGQRDASIDMSVTPPRLEIGRSVANGLRFSGAATGVSPTITTTGDAFANVSIVASGTAPVVLGGVHTTGARFFPALQSCSSQSSSTTAVPVRIAQNDWALGRTSAASNETHNYACFLDMTGTRTTASKGIRIAGLTLVHQITVSAAATNTFNAAAIVTYANATANAIDTTTLAASATMPTATQATPYVTTVTWSGPVFLTTAASGINIDWTAVLTNTTVYRVYGALVTYSHALY